MTSARPRLRVLSHRELGLQHRNWGAGTNVQSAAGRLVKTKLSRKPQPLCVSPARPLAALFRSRTHACIPHCVRAHGSKTPPRCWASSLHALRASELCTFPRVHPPPEAVGEVQCAGRLRCLVFVGCGRREGTHRPRGLSDRTVASRCWRPKPEVRCQSWWFLAGVLFLLTDGHLPLAVSLTWWGWRGEGAHTLVSRLLRAPVPL